MFVFEVDVRNEMLVFGWCLTDQSIVVRVPLSYSYSYQIHTICSTSKYIIFVLERVT